MNNYQQKSKSGVMICSKCTLRGHLANNCRTECRWCKKVGHIKKNCDKHRGKMHNVEESSSDQNVAIEAESMAELEASSSDDENSST